MSIGIKDGWIRLDEPTGVFYSGQDISGSVFFLLDQPLTFTSLAIKYYGAANVLWTEIEERVDENGMEREYTVRYMGQEIYLNYTENLIGGNGTSRLPKGSHAIPFKYHIPSIAPSSFKGLRGGIDYFVTAIMTYVDPLEKKDKICKKFKVVAPLDLNTADPSVKKPIDMEFEEVYGCDLFCVPDPVYVHIRLPVSGYCPGQSIPINIQVKNNSSHEITKMIFQLVTKECYRSTCPVAVYVPPERVIATTKSGAVMGNSKCTFKWELPVPNMIAPHLNNCSIIDLQYYFRITIKVSGCGKKMQDESEVYIGLVPLNEITELYTHPLSHELPMAPIPGITGTKIEANHSSPLHDTPDPNYETTYSIENPPYPNENPIYPAENPPYPKENPSYSAEKPPSLSKHIPYTTENQSYSLKNPPYPNENPIYPAENPPYPKENPSYSAEKPPSLSKHIPYTPENQSYSLKNPPYPNENPIYLAENPPYPKENPSYSAEKPPSLSKHIPYTTQNQSYPAENPPYSTEHPPYPAENPPYPIRNPPYPAENPPYPKENPHYLAEKPPSPTENPTYPSGNPPHPTGSPPYTTHNPPYTLQNNVQIQSMHKDQFRDYEIGFKALDNSKPNPPYPDMDIIQSIPPYPTTNLMPSPLPTYAADDSGVHTPPYPISNAGPQVPSNGSFSPSAPPPSR